MTSGFWRAGVLLLALLPVAQAACAQATVTAGPDSVAVSTPAVPDSTRRTEKLLWFQVTRPTKAAVFSALLPGAGQIYNRKYWKLPLVYGAVGGTLANEIYLQRLFKEYQRGYDARTDKDSTTIDEGPRSSQERTADNVKTGEIFYRGKRDLWIGYTALAYGMQIVDALVDAHLQDFDVSDDLSMHWEPTILRMPTLAPTPGIAVSFTIKPTRSSK
ncbi:DUF5683 domain-containing protein [Hymenobacter sp. BT175]|uniref:DUF5683 domain-containing protein n=1 Tax=Hymenobacter translucens TaxID=2886507 RepID=UPI001D0ECB67|nr:DUF5683 domain-containing protein [Hymenobacter translucens]MCC2547118.1 DUF5683 domain-containing protein [Hymenobacter translucens]